MLGVVLSCRRRSKSTGTRSQYASLFVVTNDNMRFQDICPICYDAYAIIIVTICFLQCSSSVWLSPI